VAAHRLLVEFVRVAFFHGDGSPGALAQAGPEAVTEVVREQAGLAADDLDRALGARGDTVPATVAKILVDVHDLPHAHDCPPLLALRAPGGGNMPIRIVLYKVDVKVLFAPRKVLQSPAPSLADRQNARAY
jgi:hypothetical protein